MTETIATPTPTPAPTPIESFNNSKLRASVATALSTVPLNHGNAILNVNNKGAGVMVLHRYQGARGPEWGMVFATRYNFEDRKPEVEAAVSASW